MLSEAFALTVVVPDTVAPAAGVVMFTAGGVVSEPPPPDPPLKATTCITQPLFVLVAVAA